MRGGILADAPGLGKTVTLLALICQSIGIRPASTNAGHSYRLRNEEVTLIQQAWENVLSQTDDPILYREILQCLRPIRTSAMSQEQYSQLVHNVTPPFGTPSTFPTFASWERYIHSQIRKYVSRSTVQLFRRNVRMLGRGLIRRTNSSFSESSSISLDSSTATAPTNGSTKRQKRNRRISTQQKEQQDNIPTDGTLIIVPDALLEHWAEQIRRHVHLPYFMDDQYPAPPSYELPNSMDDNTTATKTATNLSWGVVYIDGVGDLSTARFPLNHTKEKLPSEINLLMYSIVVVPFSRVSEEYRQGVRRNNGNFNDVYKSDGRDDDIIVEGAVAWVKSSPLLKLRWLRVVVDEGHELGENETESHVTRFIHEVDAERRWVLSGTPTTGDEDSPEFTSKGLDQLQRLLIFLRHETYGIIPPPLENEENADQAPAPKKKKRSETVFKSDKRKQARSAWDTYVKMPFLQKKEAGRNELYRVLNEVMVIHKKEDLLLPKPIFKQADINVRVPSNIQTTIFDAISTNMSANMTTYLSVLRRIGVDIDKMMSKSHCELLRAIRRGSAALFEFMISQYYYTDDYQKLVDEAQGYYIADSISRARRELEARGGPISDRLHLSITASSDRTSSSGSDRRPIKTVVYSNSSLNLADVTEYLHLRFKPENIAELNRGQISSMSYELGRFRNNYKEGKYCPICGGWNDSSGKKLLNCSNLLMEVSDRNGGKFLIEPQRVLRAVSIGTVGHHVVGTPVDPARFQGESLAKYGQITHKHWKVGDALCVDLRDPHPLLQKRWDETTWEKFGSQKCKRLMMHDMFMGKDGYLGPFPVYEDGSNAVFVKLNKWQPCGRFHGRSRWYTGPTLENASIENVKEDVFVLSLDASFSHGLDLSFVTHIFLLEPIDDAALLEQVTARAHRMGSTGPVVIETVNVWPELDPTHEITDTAPLSNQAESKTGVGTGIKTVTSTAVCEYCYRSFENIEKAELHEKTCDRNPDGTAVIDPFHLSAVYRDIRPPPPVPAGRIDPSSLPS